MAFPSTSATNPPVPVAYGFLLSFPIACFFLAMLTDIAYWQTANLLWLHFSEWLLLAGLAFGFLAGILAVARRLRGRIGPAWPTMAGYAIVFLLAVLNSFIHTADGWTAVVPYGLATSVATVVLMAIVALFGRTGGLHA